MLRMVYPFLPAFGRGLGIELPVLSLAITARSAMGTLGLFFAFIADNRGRKVGMISGLVLYCLGALIVVLKPTFATFVVTLCVTMLGKYIFDPAMQAYLGDKVPYQRRGRVFAFTELGWSFSFIFSIPLIGYLIARAGWLAPFPLLALLGLFSIVLLMRILPKDPEQGGRGLGTWRNLRAILGSRPALAALAMSTFISASNEVVNLVFGVWMEDAFHLQIAALGASAAVIGLSELGGEVFSAGLVDRLGKPKAVGLGILLSSLAALLLPILGRTLPGALVGLFLFYITFEYTLVSAIPLMTEILPSARATLMATNIAGHSIGRALGALVGSPLYSYGILGNGIAALAFNLLALYALGHLMALLPADGNPAS